MSRLLEKGYGWNLGGLLARSCGFSCVARHRGGMGLSVAKQTVDFLGSETGRTCCDLTCLTNMIFHIMIWLLFYFWMFLMNVLFPTREMGGSAFHCFFLTAEVGYCGAIECSNNMSTRYCLQVYPTEWNEWIEWMKWMNDMNEWMNGWMDEWMN